MDTETNSNTGQVASDAQGQAPDSLGANNQPQIESSSMMATLEALKGIGGEGLAEEISGVRSAEQQKAPTPVGTAPTSDNEGVAAPKDGKDVESDILKDIAKEKAEEIKEDTPGKEDQKAEAIKTTINSPIFGGEKDVSTKKEVAEEVKFEGSDIANKFIKEKTGYENIESLVGWTEEAKVKVENHDKALQEVQGFNELFKSMPPQLYEAVNAHYKGEDWKSGITSKPNLDFTKNAEDHSEIALVNNYLPEQFSKEDWEDYKSEDADTNLKRAIDMAINTSREKYKSDRGEIEGLQTKRLEEAQARETSMANSIGSSLDHLRNNIEGVDDRYVAQIGKDLNVKTITEIFFNPDGSFKKDAALKLTMAQNGHEMMEQYKEIANRKAENKERQDVLLRTPDKVKARSSGTEGSGEINPELQAALTGISSSFKKKSVY